MNDRLDKRQLWLGALHLGVLWAFAFQKPLFDILGRNPEFFVVRGNTRGDIVVFALCFTLLPPLAMAATEWVALRFRPALYRPLHLAFVALLGAAIVLQFLKDNVASGPAAVLLLAALALGALLALAYRRTAFAPQALSVLAPAPLLFLLLFLFVSPVHKLILPQAQARALDVDVPSRAPVVMLITDELPIVSLMDADGKIDAGRFPNFAQLAAHSTWYRNATTVAGFTTRAVPAILTGQDPGDRLPISSDQPNSIFTLLGGSYEMNVDETATSICPVKICGGEEIEAVGGAVRRHRESNGLFRVRMHQLVSDLTLVSEHLLLPRAIAEHLPSIDQTFGNFGQGGDTATTSGGSGNANQVQVGETIRKGAFSNRTQRFQRFVDSIDGAPKTFNFLHIEFPHFPWLYEPDGKRYVAQAPDIALADGVWPDNAYQVSYGWQRHFLQSALTDKLLGDLIARMKKVGLWDKAVFVVTADHGGSFIPGERRRDPTRTTLGEIAPVPLFVMRPGQKRGEVVDDHRCTTQILPIIAALLHVKPPFKTGRCSDTVTVAQYNGEPAALPLAEVLKQRAAALKRRLALFGAGDGLAPLYRFGPDSELIGRTAAGVPAAPATGASVALRGRGYTYKPESGTIPVLVQGTLSGVEEGQPLAIAVNGVIVTTGEAFDLLGETRVAATIPQEAIRPGQNQVDVYRVADGRLERLGGSE
jgi:sulfatase-like protein